MNDSVEYWDERYRSGRVAWDAGGVPADARRFIRTAAPGRVLVPGCGAGYEIAAFADAGWSVTGVELSSAAIETARRTIGARADCILHDDFFALRPPAPFDVVYERAFLCAIPPACWQRYAAKVHDVLRPGGTLAGYFYYGHEAEPPPYPLTGEGAQELLGRDFALEEDSAVTDSLPIYADGERWQVWRKLLSGQKNKITELTAA